MSKYEEITRARQILGLLDTATIEEIKGAYRCLMHRWHPDLCSQDSEKAHEMTRKITEAYQILLDYCANYRYPFCKEAVKKQRNPEEWWMEQFGNKFAGFGKTG